MIKIIYLVITLYFALGAFATYLVFRKREKAKLKQAWIKYWVYLIIVFSLTTILHYWPGIFPVLAALILIMGWFELIRALLREPDVKFNTALKLLTLILYGLLNYGFLSFSFTDGKNILFTYLVVASFDAFSQITGQVFGRHKAFPRISPSKTIEGLVLGLLITIPTGGLLFGLNGFSFGKAFLFTAIISLFSLAGDLSASSVKRMCGIKDFSAIIPGHGGVLDRFDSLIAGGTAMFILFYLIVP